MTITSPSGRRLRADIPPADGLPPYGIRVMRLELDLLVLEAAETAGAAFAPSVLGRILLSLGPFSRPRLPRWA
jgi:hypothetical protein